MAARGIALGRIIDWFKSCDPEEGKFAIHRAANILQERESRVDLADAAGKVKRARRAANAKPQQPAPVATISQAAGE